MKPTRLWWIDANGVYWWCGESVDPLTPWLLSNHDRTLMKALGIAL